MHYSYYDCFEEVHLHICFGHCQNIWQISKYVVPAETTDEGNFVDNAE